MPPRGPRVAAVWRRNGPEVRPQAPIKALIQRFTYFLLIGGAMALMLLGKVETVLIEEARVRLTDAVAPLLDGASAPLASVAHLGQEARAMLDLHAENERLREENGRLVQWQSVARRLEAENRSLQELLRYTPEPGATYISARVVGDTGGPFQRNVLINAGSRVGVQKPNVAVTGEGLVGRIVQVGDRSSRVLLLTDLNSRIPVVIEGSRQRAILAGDNSDRPQLQFLTGEGEIQVGERVVTSGQGGVFPPGLPVGVVSKAGGHPARVDPFVNLKRLEYLRVVSYKPVPPPEAGK